MPAECTGSPSGPTAITSSPVVCYKWSTIAQLFNLERFTFCRGSINTPYPTAQDVYDVSNTSAPESDFLDLYLCDMIIARRRVVHHKLAKLEMCHNQRKFVLGDSG